MTDPRIPAYFRGASTCSDNDRRMGLEVETLFVSYDPEDGNSPQGPMSLNSAQSVMRKMASEDGWRTAETRGTLITLVSSHAGFDLCFDLGHSELEVITPSYWVPDRMQLINDTQSVLTRLYRCAYRSLDAGWAPYKHYDHQLRPTILPAESHFDGYSEIDTLIIPDKRDEIWLQLDGPVLKVLGHIAAVHINLDLKSIEEGMRCIKILNSWFRKLGWPLPESREAWSRYIVDSQAQYEANRIGSPPETFGEYCDALAGMKVVMNKDGNGNLSIVNPPSPFCQMDIGDMDMFLRSIWWNSRLRVRNGNLVLEIRAIPRSTDARLESDVELILDILRENAGIEL